ncbi:MAG TPA: 5-formyltetrahydrofolate cyclo-ligase [Candidatus Thermoplasmatota archaeon]|nr:5-formyltetrahydrofolate cyclo-ligase [Candidatus Thermoplasmatota archaeon]
MSINKEKIREQLRKQRTNKSKDFIIKNSERISENLCNLEAFKKADHILFYISYNGEVDTHNLLKKTISIDKKVYVPISNTTNHTLQLSHLSKFSDLSPGTYGILEPKKEKIKPTSIHEIDMVLVPGVAFDQFGHRLGQGGGYYDWFLSKTDVISIGLAFEFQILKEIPLESHDQRVDLIATEKQLIECTKY